MIDFVKGLKALPTGRWVTHIDPYLGICVFIYMYNYVCTYKHTNTYIRSFTKGATSWSSSLLFMRLCVCVCAMGSTVKGFTKF